MEREPFLAPSAITHLQHLPQDDDEILFTVPESIQNQVIYEELEDPFGDFSSPPQSSCHHPEPTTTTRPSSTGLRSKSGLHRSRTAPAMAVLKQQHPTQTEKPKFESSSIVRQAFLLLIFYLSLGVVTYSFNRDNFSGIETHPVADALYFCIVTMCTIGYGDIAPTTPATKENMILTSIQVGGSEGSHDGKFSAKNYIFNAEKGRMRIRMKVGLALGVVVLCIGTGTMIFYFVEKLDWVDSVYLSVMSVTTVGYGDRAFKTMQGRLFASVWLLFSTLAVARAFLYLAEARIDKRHRRITKWVLHREITVEDLLAADINNNGFISKSEYVLYKLKEMGKISEKDMLQICDQFNKLDLNNSGKITLPDLLQSRRPMSQSET